MSSYNTHHTPHPPSLSRNAPLASDSTFYQALHLDSPTVIAASQLLEKLENEEEGDYEDISEESEEPQEYRGTKPLRVKKKKIVARVAATSANRRSRRSTLSLPQSPRSPGFPKSPTRPTPKRNPSTSTARSATSPHPHATISRLFLTLPATSPSPTAMTTTIHYPYSHSMAAHCTTVGGRTSARAKRSSGSSLHLGLGRFASYDPVVPGPSPPASPAASPTKRSFGQAIYERKPLPTIPPSPLTPSRAPRKAAELLGAGFTTPRKGKPSGSARPTKHFRPLPNAALTEIERFFGDVPRKASKTPPGLKTKASSKSRQAAVHGAQEAGNGEAERKVGEGVTVGYKGQDGSMWMDVEEEQEFAWLMSEVAAVPAPLPLVDAALARQERAVEGIQVMYESEEGEAEKWGMEAFTSVLSLPKPRVDKTPKKARAIEESFFDFEDTPRVSKSRPVGETSSAHPWSLRHTRSHSNPTPLSPKLSISPPMPVVIPPARSSSKNRAAQDGGYFFTGAGSSPPRGAFTSGAGTSPGSPPRIKNRPPPLTLPQAVPSGKLPVLTATSPTARHGAGAQPRSLPSQSTLHAQAHAHGYGERRHAAPSTPFVRPRTAPKPMASSPPPPMPINLLVPAMPNGMRGEREERDERPSYFEPVTPVEAAPPGGGKGMGWLKKVVGRPLKV
ncbi:hypothetical protein IAT38_001708 [Cryptococcus sp. DSM 104549]